jgi:hypothetical protein
MANGAQTQTPTQTAPQDPWAVVSETPAPANSDPTGQHSFRTGIGTPSGQADPWSVVTEMPADAPHVKFANGEVHQIHSDDVHEALRRNPGATVMEAGGTVLSNRGDELAAKGLSAAGLPTSIADIPNWFQHFIGVAKDSRPVWDAFKRAVEEPTQENLVGAVPIVGPASVAMSKDIQKRDYLGALATLAGTLAIPKVVETGGAVVKAGGKAIGKTAGAVGELPSKIKGAADPVTPESLTKRAETPAPQHGAPVRVESPLDGPTVGKQLGGKDLSQEALDALQEHVGDKIAVGSTAKNMLMKAVEPISRKISETSSQMNDVVQKAPQFTTSVMQDNVFGEGSFTSEIETLKKNLPASVRESLAKDVDAVVEDADKVLNSNDPAEVLEQRRLLGKRIDWDKIEKNPSTPTEVQNLARVKVYQALGDKIHSEIPETVSLDKVLQPNLELRSHMATKLGQRVIEDPHAATVEHQSEFRKGQTTIDNAIHNEAVARNWKIIRAAALAAGAGAYGLDKLWKLFE